jgi:hypothetical protein
MTQEVLLYDVLEQVDAHWVRQGTSLRGVLDRLGQSYGMPPLPPAPVVAPTLPEPRGGQDFD